VKYFIPDTSVNPKIALAEGVSADAKGDVYAAGVSSMGLHKFVKPDLELRPEHKLDPPWGAGSHGSLVDDRRNTAESRRRDPS
jgi:hypothetical protein